MAQIYVEVEENPNCGYSPLQAFQTLEPPRSARSIVIPEAPGKRGRHEVIGWSSDGDGKPGGGDGKPAAVTYVRVTDSGAGSSLLISGGDYGIRMRPVGDQGDWRIGDPRQWGEPYLLLDPATRIEPLEPR